MRASENAQAAGAVIGGAIAGLEDEIENTPKPDSPDSCGSKFFARALPTDPDSVKIIKFDRALTFANDNAVACEAWWQENYRQAIGG